MAAVRERRSRAADAEGVGLLVIVGPREGHLRSRGAAVGGARAAGGRGPLWAHNSEKLHTSRTRDEEHCFYSHEE